VLNFVKLQLSTENNRDNSCIKDKLLLFLYCDNNLIVQTILIVYIMKAILNQELNFKYEVSENSVKRTLVRQGSLLFHYEIVPIRSGETFEDVIKKMEKKEINSRKERELVDSFKELSIEQVMAHPSYSHARYREYGITFYAYCSSSPSNFISVGGCSNSEVSRVQKCLSPTESR
jgi:hypothetical protein